MSEEGSRPPVAVLTGSPDDVELVAALAAVSLVTGRGEVGRRLGGHRPPTPAAAPVVDPWTARGRATAAAQGTAQPGPARRIHRWSRSTSQRT